MGDENHDEVDELEDKVGGDIDRDLKEGDEVGEYVIESKLGEGGFGTVYRATHPLIGKQAAVKVLDRQYSSDPEMVSRFVSEARAVNTIKHANIIDIFSFGTLSDGRRYFVMELLSGLPFDAYLRDKGPLEPGQVVQIMRRVARAVDAAHDKGIVHRDLKPENIFLSFDDEGRPVPKLLDFGIAKLRGDAAVTGHKTRTGAPIGTPQYMSPEQCLGTEVDGRTDVYAFGVLCFEAITGSPPFEGNSYLELMTKQTTADRPPASGRRESLGTGFDEALQTIMSLDKEQRPVTLCDALGLIDEAARKAGYAMVDTPAELPSAAALSSANVTGEADTVMDASSAIGTTSKPASTTRAPLVVGGVLVVAVLAYLVSGGLGDEAAQPGQAPQPSTSAPPSAAPAATPSEIAVASPSSVVPEPTAPIFVELTCNARGARAYRGDGKPTPLPGRLQLDGKEGDKQSITVKAPGYRDKTVDIELRRGAKIEVTLERIVRRKRLNKDLENPDL